MIFTPFITPRFRAVIAASTVLATTAYAQITAPQTDQRKSAAKPYQSAFEGYRAHTDEPVADWKTANDTAARIGGWREYAKQAKSEEVTPTRTVEPAAKPTSKVAP